VISSGQMLTYFNSDVITYACIPGYSPKNLEEIVCMCNVTKPDNHWLCSIPADDFETECEKG